jgi:hypothetical protein
MRTPPTLHVNGRMVVPLLLLGVWQREYDTRRSTTPGLVLGGGPGRAAGRIP